MVFGTGSTTYTMPGIESAASLGAQVGPTEFVTTDAAGDLASFDLFPVLAGINTRINRLVNRTDHVRHEEEAGVAMAIGLGQIRYDERPGKFSIGAGAGGFQHEAGGGLGMGYTTPSGRFRFNIAGGGDTNGDFGGGGGVTITFGEFGRTASVETLPTKK
jgi:trimeric autotransporter adhesin